MNNGTQTRTAREGIVHENMSS